MSEMIERVAKALADATADGTARFDTYPKWKQDELRDLAYTALGAIRDAEPTDEMMSALWSARMSNTKESFAACWQSMIDAALKDD